MSPFHLGGSSTTSSSDTDDDDANLPYPTPLQRRDFLAPSFSPSTYLSTLQNRHQTLEDLRSELRSRSQHLSKELLDLVNSNYQDFLGLGRSLRGGEEKVEEVRVGLLGFRKEVDGIRGKVVEREDVVKGLLEERVEIGRSIAIGRKLMEIDARLGALEGRLMVDLTGKADEDEDDFEDNDSEDEEDDEGSFTVSVSQLRRHILQYRLLREIVRGVGDEHPFVAAQMPRFIKIRNTLLLDLSTALREARAVKGAGDGRVLRVLRAYEEMDEGGEAVRVLKSDKA